MWTVVYIARNRIEAETLKGILDNEGILAMLRAVGVPHLGDSGNVEILVPESEAEEAHAILNTVII
ncbi:MAG: DUF2007 domain-containing protein [Firmicutes bacterium]|nr:DUF2007 domain-containing protein [Bacillota bacterium]